MAKSNASSHKLYLVESTVAKLVAELTSIQLTFNGDIIDLTSKDNNGFRDILVGLMSFSLNVEGFVDFQPGTDNRNFDEIMTAARARTLSTLLLKNATSGDSTHQGTAYVTNLELTSGMETGLTFSATFEFKGDLTVGVVS